MNQNYKDLYFSVVNKIYSKYTPQKIEEIPTLFKKYEGREKELIEQICKKYNVGNEEFISFTEEYRQIFHNKPKNNTATVIIVLTAIMAVVALLCWKYYNDKNDSNTAIKNTEIVETKSKVNALTM